METKQLHQATRVWQTPTIRRVGTFGSVMTGGSRPNPDPGSANRKMPNA